MPTSKRNIKIAALICAYCALLGRSAPAQAIGGSATSPTSATSSTGTTSASPKVPVYALYRMFFAHVAALDNTAASLTAPGKASESAQLQNWYQKTLNLTAAETTQLKQVAASCNSQLAQQGALAQQTIATAKTSVASTAAPGNSSNQKNLTASPAVVAQLAQLEQGRTTISNGCIQSLQSALSAKTFNNIDAYVKTSMAGRTWVAPPPLVKPTKAPPLPNPNGAQQ